MIIVKDEENKIVEMFDTVKEFKTYIDDWILEIRENDYEVYKDFIVDDFDKTVFQTKLNMYLEITQEIIKSEV